MPIEPTLEDAFTNIDSALAQLNANRKTHDILTASVERVKNEIAQLHAHLTATLPSPPSDAG